MNHLTPEDCSRRLDSIANANWTEYYLTKTGDVSKKGAEWYNKIPVVSALFQSICSSCCKKDREFIDGVLAVKNMVEITNDKDLAGKVIKSLEIARQVNCQIEISITSYISTETPFQMPTPLEASASSLRSAVEPARAAETVRPEPNETKVEKKGDERPRTRVVLSSFELTPASLPSSSSSPLLPLKSVPQEEVTSKPLVEAVLPEQQAAPVAPQVEEKQEVAEAEVSIEQEENASEQPTEALLVVQQDEQILPVAPQVEKKQEVAEAEVSIEQEENASEQPTEVLLAVQQDEQILPVAPQVEKKQEVAEAEITIVPKKNRPKVPRMTQDWLVMNNGGVDLSINGMELILRPRHKDKPKIVRYDTNLAARRVTYFPPAHKLSAKCR